jgi:transmembrane sensor
MNTSQEQITNEAAEWLLRLEDNPDGRGHTDFVAWLKLSPRHMDEFLMVEAAYRAVSHADAGRRLDIGKLVTEARADILPLPGNPDIPSAIARNASPAYGREGARRLAQAATVLIVAGITFLAFHIMRDDLYSTDIGEQNSFKLADGSLLHLNTHSAARVRFTDERREVELVQGEAFFTVRQEASRPFSVRAGVATVQVLGTSFNVYRRNAEHTRVSVIEGRVQLDSQPLEAGQEADAKGAGVAINANPNIGAAIAWRQRRLVFRTTPLAEVAAEFNRYNTELRLELNSDALAQRRITGTFNADEPQTLVRFLRQDPAVRFDTRNGVVTIRATQDVE